MRGVEETPEQTLARLARYRDSLNRTAKSPINGVARSPLLAPRTIAPTPPAPWAAPAPTRPTPSGRATTVPAGARAAATTTLAPTPTPVTTPTVPAGERGWDHAADRKPLLSHSAVRTTLFGQLLAVVGAIIGIVSFEQLSGLVAAGIVLGLTAVGIVGAVRRVPLALWWTFGIVIGGLLGRWS